MATRQEMLGEWYTPDHLVEYTQNIITTLNTDWRNHLVIDPACGQANLTRRGEFSDLLLSTIRQDEINIILENNYNNGNDVYKIDFLNDDLPDEYIEKLENAKYVTWYMNPPYGTAGKAGATSKSKKGVNKNKINTEMKKSKLIGRAAQQLYVGFIWRITRLMEKYNLKGRMCMFTNSIFMTGSSYKKFRKWFCKKWKFEAGCIMPAPEFGCKGKWPVAFTCWEWGEEGLSDRFMLDVVERGKKIGVQEFYNTDKCESGSEWIKPETKVTEKLDLPHQTSGIKFKELGSYNKNYNRKGQVGYIHNKGNNIVENASGVSLTSLAYSNGHAGLPLFPDNFLRCILLFAARKLVIPNWINQKLEYLAPQKVEGPLQSSGLLFKEKGRGSSVEGMLGDMYNDNNNVYKNAQSVALYSAGFSSANNQVIFPDNFLRCILLFTARRLIKDNWIIHQAEYLAPQKVEGPLQKSGLVFTDKGYGREFRNTICWMENNANNIQSNAQYVALYSVGNSRAHSLPLFPDNFLRCILLFTARRLIKDNWIIHQAEYLAPQPTPPLLQFAADSLVYALFEIKNNMTACRNIMHKGKPYRIKNNLFWHNMEQVKPHCYLRMFEDLKQEKKDPYITNHLCTLNGKYYVLIDDPKICDEPVIVQVSLQAQKVMELADKLWVDSLEKREEYAQEHPEYHLDSWDAGYYQLKYLWREHFPEQQKELRKAYKKLEEQMIPQVYETGFLRRGYERDTEEIKEVN
jgi:hypothetical protein